MVPLLEMFTSSIGKVGRSGPAIARPLSVAFSAQAHSPKAVAAAPHRPLSYRSHQRRHSSSKSSGPSNGGSRGITAAQRSTAATSPSSSPAAQTPGVEKRSSGRAERRATKDVVTPLSSGSKEKFETLRSLPSVPSTNHVHPAGRYLVADDGRVQWAHD